MANPSPDRRKVLALLGRVTLVSQFPGFRRWACGLSNTSEAFANTPVEAYRPLFFSAAEFATADELTEQIIPQDTTPGAREAGVAEFIDFMAAHDTELQYPLRSGLAWLDAFSIETRGARFVALPPDGRAGILRRLAYKSERSMHDREGHEFFDLFRKWTVIGYYTSRAGLEELNYPGLRIYATSPECPHKDNPEHLNLREPA